MNYDLMLSDAKRAATLVLLDLQRENSGVSFHKMASALDELNKRWDQLTDALVRQRDERDELIRRLINDLAEAKKRN